MTPTADDFRQAAADNNITKWPIHTCGFCHYPCGYLIDGDQVAYDTGCWCSPQGPREPRPASWDEIADHYNRNQPENNPRAAGTTWLADMQTFWGMDSSEPAH